MRPVQENPLPRAERDELQPAEFTAGRATWAVPPEASEFRATCRIRYRHTPEPCTVVLQGKERFAVRFDQPQTSVTPGQAAVFYDGERTLGRGWITG